MRYVLWAAAVMSLIAFCTMGWDKMLAKKKARRVPEKTLFLLTILMGGIGGTLGMWVFRHKTKHWYFAWGFPLIAVLQIALMIYLVRL